MQSTLASFLLHTKQQLSSLPPRPPLLHLVLGNEAGDADSLISSLCFAFFKQIRYQQHTEKTDCTNQEVLYVPAAGIARADLALRCDVELALNKVGLSCNSLICLEEIPQIFKLSNEKLIRITLVDHNALAADLESSLGPTVVEILDHHDDRGFYKWVKQEEANRNIAFVDGKPSAMSTCTLVAESFFQMPSKNDLCRIDTDVATLLLAVIAVDSANLENATQRDLDVVEKLQKHVPTPREELYSLLVGAKLDPHFWENLSVTDALRLDYKLFQVESRGENSVSIPSGCRRIGISSVLQPLEAFYRKERHWEIVLSFMLTQDLTCFAIMTFVIDPAPKRELLLVSKSSLHLQDLQRHLSNPANGLDLYAGSDAQEAISIDGVTLFASSHTQGNVRASRKVIAPLILNFEEKRPC